MPRIRQPIVSILGHVDHGKCVHPDTLVYVPELGPVRIEDLYEMEMPPREVFSLGPGGLERVPIRAYWRLEHDGYLWEIRPDGWYPVRVTPEHPFLTPRGWVRADSLRVGDRIALALGFEHARLEAPKGEVEASQEEAITLAARGLALRLEGGVLVPEGRGSGIRFLRVREARRVRYRGPVYDLTTGNGNFVANSIIVHNTTLLDRIRGTRVAEREAGGITQHIGATEIPLWAIEEIAKGLVKPGAFRIPGLLFIDTPGHRAFTTLRARGGALADLAVLVVDVREGIMPQTDESLHILRAFKTPFVVAANKIDLLPGWRKIEDVPFRRALEEQDPMFRRTLEERILNLVEALYHRGFSAERYDRITDFTRNVAIVPVSAKHGVGIPDLLLLLVGLAQRFLERRLMVEEGPAEGTVLEVKRERGLGTTLDTIIYSGVLRRGDTIVVGAREGIIVTRVRAILRPKPLDEIRDPRHPFRQEREVSAAVGVKIVAANTEGAVPGSPVKAVWREEDLERVKLIVKEELKPKVKTEAQGIVIKADALGSLEALAYELGLSGWPIKRAEIGEATKRDVVEAATNENPFYRILVAFNVPISEEVREAAASQGVEVVEARVIYDIVDRLHEVRAKIRERLERELLRSVRLPAKILLLPEHVFRYSKPAIVGVRVLDGILTVGAELMRPDGKVVGRIRSMRIEDRSVREARAGQELAIAIDGPTVGRQIKPGDLLYVRVPEGDLRRLEESPLFREEFSDLVREIRDILRKLR
ncbi:MAG: translation initiation factor IF-2 [Thermoplasmata archaeon]|nr:translation initiation factor IF-2 [Thermoplasmata archaeon]